MTFHPNGDARYCPDMEGLHTFTTIGGGTGPGKEDKRRGDRLGQTLVREEMDYNIKLHAPKVGEV